MKQCRFILSILVYTVTVTMACRRPSQDAVTPTQAKPDVCGCMDAAALNYDPTATKTDGAQCKYAIDSICGVYDATDTQIIFTSRGPDTTVSSFSLTVCRAGASLLRFDTVLMCEKCAMGSIPYSASNKSFEYTSYSDAYTSNGGSGHFESDTIYYQQRITNSLSGYTPRRWGRGVKRH